MVTKCANPQCATPFRYLRGGKLIAIPKTPNQADCCPPAVAIECFWLCDECAPLFSLIVKRGAGLVCVPKLPVIANEPKLAEPDWLRASEESAPAEFRKAAS